MAAVLLAATLLIQTTPALPARDGQILYVVSRATITREQPDLRARGLRKLSAFDIVTGTETIAGWLEIGLSTGTEGVRGQWIPLDRENIVTGNIEALKYRVAKAQQARWPDRVRLDVVRGRIRCGFTAEQVRLALGDPRDKTLRHSAREVAEEWIYDDLRIVVSMRGVTDIKRVNGER